MSLISIKKLKKKDRHWDDIIKNWNISNCEMLEATFMELPAGLIAYNKDIKQVKFIYVLEKLRNLGIGTLLLKQIDKGYSIEWSNSIDDESLRSVLSNLGWSKPKKEDYFFHISKECPAEIFHEIELEKTDIRKWSNSYIKEVSENSPKELVPGYEDWSENSIAMFENNKLIGWAVTKKHDNKKAIEYAKVFILGKRIGLGAVLMFFAVKKHKELFPDYDGICKINCKNFFALIMVERHLEKYIIKKSTIYSSSFN